ELSSEGELSEGERRARDETIQAELGGMPLAVEIAARSVAELNLSWSEYRAHLNQHCRSALESARYTGDYPRGIFAAIDLSIERCEEGSCERRLLFAVGRFAPEPIDRQWAVEVANLGVPELALRSCGSKLRDLGLVQEQVPNEVWVLHSLVHARVTELLPEDAD